MEIITTCCIAGGGPAGMMLGLLLAREGIRVVVLEKHSDFLRDFRGDTVHPSTLQVLDDIGLISRFLALPHSEVNKLAPPVAPGSSAVIDLRELDVRYPFIAFIPQWDLLNLLAEEGKRHPSFQLLMEAEVESLISENGEVKGLRYRSQGELHEVRAVLTVGADGRTSAVREAAGLELAASSPQLDVLWFRISRRSSDPDGVLGKGGGGLFGILLNRNDYWQVAFVIPKGAGDAIRAEGIEAFRQRAAKLAPEYAERMVEIKSWDDVKLLSVRSDRVRRWWKPGLLVIGDAAHAMSPVAGVGINLAIQDAVAAFNLLAPALLVRQLLPGGHRAGKRLDRDLAAVQRRRQLPTFLTQRVQEVMQRIVIDRIRSGNEAAEIPRGVQLLLGIRAVRKLGASFIALGFRPERVRPLSRQ
jgi:2-polyprenyl-6-methoxyphenol hydroxylase-like FAD-dependent oxidoreductase